MRFCGRNLGEPALEGVGEGLFDEGHGRGFVREEIAHRGDWAGESAGVDELKIG